MKSADQPGGAACSLRVTIAPMDAKTHWEHVYATKSANQVSWYRPHLDVSLDLVLASRPPEALGGGFGRSG